MLLPAPTRVGLPRRTKGTVVGRDGRGSRSPWHGAKFDVRTGAILGPPAGQAAKTYPVRVTGPDIEIEV